MNFVVANKEELAEAIWGIIRDRAKKTLKIGLRGELGSGKTTLVQGIAKKLGVKGVVSSPTFVIGKIYPVRAFGQVKYLQHLDLYRLQNRGSDKKEIEDWLNRPDSVTFIEWCEKIKGIENLLDLIIGLELISETKRKVKIKWI